MKVKEYIIKPIGEPLLRMEEADHSMLSVSTLEMAAGGRSIREVEEGVMEALIVTA